MTDDVYLKKLGLKVSKLRTHEELSQRELAIKCGLKHTQIRKMEIGEVNPTIITLRKVAKYFNLTVGQLVDVK